MPSYHAKTKRPLPNIEDLAHGTEFVLDYQFDNERLAVSAISLGDERTRLANLPSLPSFGDNARLAAAADVSGLSELLYPKQTIRNKVLAEVVYALLGAVYEDSGDEVEMLRAAGCLGLEPVEEDLLGVEEFRYVKCEWERVLVASEESLI